MHNFQTERKQKTLPATNLEPRTFRTLDLRLDRNPAAASNVYNLVPRVLPMGKTLVGAGGGQSIKLHASTKNVTLQLQGVDQSQRRSGHYT